MSSPIVWMKGMWFEWLPSLTGPVPLLTKERCLVVTTLPAVSRLIVHRQRRQRDGHELGVPHEVADRAQGEVCWVQDA